MGRRSYTNYAIYNGERITSARATRITEGGTKVQGCRCIECNAPMKFVKGVKVDSYFAHIVPKGAYLSCKEAGGEGHLHELAKRFFADFNLWGKSLYITDDIQLDKEDILSVSLEKSITYCGSSIRPDVTIETTKGVLYIEVVNTHKLTMKTKGVYRSLRKSGEEFKLLEIKIDDLDSMAGKCPDYFLVKRTLEERLLGKSEFKSIVNLDVRYNEKTPFGTCYFCGKPYEIVANKADSRTGGRVIRSGKVKCVSIEDMARYESGDRTSIGSAMLHCSCCKAEGVYIPIYCPECLRSNRGYVPMKFLGNAKNGKLFLACDNYETSERKGEVSGHVCNCTLTIFNGTDNDYADELKCLSSFNGWLKGSNKEFNFVKDVRERKGAIE